MNFAHINEKQYLCRRNQWSKLKIPNRVGRINHSKFQDGLLLVNKGETWRDSRVGFMNAKGEVVIPFIYEDADAFKNGKAAVKANDRVFYIDTKGNVVSEE